MYRKYETDDFIDYEYPVMCPMMLYRDGYRGDITKEPIIPYVKQEITIQPKMDPQNFGLNIQPKLDPQSMELNIQPKMDPQSIEINLQPKMQPTNIELNIEPKMGAIKLDPIKLQLKIEPIMEPLNVKLNIQPMQPPMMPCHPIMICPATKRPCPMHMSPMWMNYPCHMKMHKVSRSIFED